MRKLTQKEKQFCTFYACSGNAEESAGKAGFRDPERKGPLLLLREEIGEEIERLYQFRMKNSRQRARTGYERLAFGSVSDAVRLMFAEDLGGLVLNSYDLFNVAEIKRPKEGAMEIKFFDRLKALEKLEMAEDPEDHPAADFYAALLHGSQEQRTDGAASGEEENSTDVDEGIFS